jgi:hypothetical protein
MRLQIQIFPKFRELLNMGQEIFALISRDASLRNSQQPFMQQPFMSMTTTTELIQSAPSKETGFCFNFNFKATCQPECRRTSQERSNPL